jgi:acyl carrier protein
MYEEKLKEALQNIGVYIAHEDFSLDLKIRDFIEDSLTFISFFVEIENLFDIEIPDEVYSETVYDYTLRYFVQEVIAPFQRMN